MRYPNIILTLMCAAVFLSCDEETVDPVDIVLSFSSQHRWTYDFVQTMTDSLGVTTQLFDDSVEVWVGSNDDAVLGMTGLIRLEARTLLSGVPPVIRSSDTARVWYRMSDRSVVEVAYQNGGGVLLLKASRPGPSSFRFSVFDPLSSFVPEMLDGPPLLREEERIVLLYPLTQFAGWVSFTRPFRQSREVEGFEEVTLPAGRFSTARIRTLTDFGGQPLVFYDWVGTDGLVRRLMRTEVILTSPDNPEGDGVATMTSETVLTSVAR